MITAGTATEMEGIRVRQYHSLSLLDDALRGKRGRILGQVTSWAGRKEC